MLLIKSKEITQNREIGEQINSFCFESEKGEAIMDNVHLGMLLY
jgi:hypothetical protein